MPGPAPSGDEALNRAVEYVRREERRRAREEAQEAYHAGVEDGREEGYDSGFKEGYRRGWSEAKGDPALAEAFGLKPDDRTWARGVLHLPPDSSLEDARRAFRTLSRQFHPDHHPELGDAPFKTLLEARRILGF